MKIRLIRSIRDYVFITAGIFFQLLSTPALSQSFTLGIRQGVNFAIQSFKTSDAAFSTDFKVGYVGGLYSIIQINENFALQPEVVFAREGSEGKANGLSIDNKLSYLLLPVLFRWQVNDHVSLQVGPQAGYLAKAESFGIDVLNDYRRVELAAVLGCGYELTNGLNFNFRFLAGLTNTNQNASATRVNNVIQLSAGYPIYRR